MNEATKDALYILAQLDAKEIAYCHMPSHGEYRGFAALHNIMDANMLLPMNKELDALVEQDERPQDAIDALCDRANVGTDEFNRIVLGDPFARNCYRLLAMYHRFDQPDASPYPLDENYEDLRLSLDRHPISPLAPIARKLLENWENYEPGEASENALKALIAELEEALASHEQAPQ